MAENLNIFGTIYSDVSGIKAYDENGDIQTYIKPEGNILINTTGQIDVSHYATASANMAALINNQNKEVTPSVLKQEIIPDSGYTGLNKVTVNAMSRGSATTPDTTITTNPTISVDNNGLITATNSKTQSVTPSVVTGYIATGTAGTITVAGSNTQQLVTQAATTYTPTTTNQTIASGTYLTGVQTIAGDANLVSNNVKKNVNIFGVTGTYEPNLVAKTVTPTANTQIVTPSTNVATIPDGNYINTTVANNRWASLNITSYVSSMVLGETYKIEGYINDTNNHATISLSGEFVYSFDSTYGSYTYIPSIATITQNPANTYNLYSTNPIQLVKFNTDNYINLVFNFSNSSSVKAIYMDTGSYINFIGERDGMSQVTVNGDNNLIADNIKYGVEIFGVTGTYRAGAEAIADEIIPLVNGGDHHSITGVDLSFDTVTASSMLLGTTAHDSAGNAITGTYVPNSDDNKTIKFIDYDGTVLHEYTPAEFAQLDSLPRNPTHAGLTSQGWNWTKTQITNQMNNVGGIIKVGQMYVTNDGKTRIYISVDNIERAKFIISFACTVSGGVTIDWGDDSALYVPSYTELKGYAHTYSAVGDYVVTLTVTNGEMIWNGNSSSGIIANRGGSTNNIITKIKKIEMGTGVTSIGDYWLQNCFALESITIPNTITSFGVNAFYSCYGLKCITIPSGVTMLTSQMFANCYNLKEVILSSTITTTTGQNIFYNCRVLNDVTLPYGLSSMATGIFYGCEDFENIVIPNSITAVSSNAFYNCHSLKTVTLPNGLTSIDSNAFYNCYTLETINIPTTVTSIGSQAFLQCFALKDVLVPSGLATLGAGAFYNCVGITSLVIPNNITSILGNTFRGCITLTSVNIPSSTTSIGEYAFGTANSLAALTIPSGVTSIGANAFDSCQGMAEYHFLPTTPPTITSTTFNAIASDCVIYVPQASLATYQAAENWSTYASQMVGE